MVAAVQKYVVYNYVRLAKLGTPVGFIRSEVYVVGVEASFVVAAVDRLHADLLVNVPSTPTQGSKAV